MASLIPQEINDFGIHQILLPIPGFTYTSLVNITVSYIRTCIIMHTELHNSSFCIMYKYGAMRDLKTCIGLVDTLFCMHVHTWV